MSAALLFKRFLKRPFQVAYVLPSSPQLTRKVASLLDFSEPRVIVEFGPGEGCHSREIAKRMCRNSRLLLIEIDAEFAGHLRKGFAGDPRVEVIHGDAQRLPEELAARGLPHCDYVVSGIPFSYLDLGLKRALLQKTHDALSPADHAAFVIYQVTPELKGHARQFMRTRTHYCLQNIPPMFIIEFFKNAGPARPSCKRRS